MDDGIRGWVICPQALVPQLEHVCGLAKCAFLIGSPFSHNSCLQVPKPEDRKHPTPGCSPPV